MKRSSSLFFILIAAFGFLVSSLTLYFMLDLEDTKRQSLLREISLELKDAIILELDKSETILKGIRGFFHSSDLVTRQEFQLFCENFIDNDFPLLLIEWQPKVQHSQVQEYEQRAQREGVENFKFFELDKEGREVPAKKRDFHFPVYYSYSPGDFPRALGLDLAFSPLRMESKYQSMKLGKAISSGSFEVILKDTELRELGFAITFPIFNDATISSSQSLEHLKGFLAIVLYLKEFFEPIEQIKALGDFAFEVRDAGDNNKVLYRSLNYEEAPKDYMVKTSVDAGERTWNVALIPTKEFLSEQSTIFPFVIWSLMILLSFGMAYYLYLKAANQEKINSYQKQLQQKQKLESMGVLASGIAHEFNNILHCIRLAGDTLDDKNSPEMEKEARETILDYCKRGRNLVREILSFSRQDSGSKEEFCPVEEVKKTVDLMRSTLGKDIAIHLHIEEKLPLLHMNRNHLSQILINLCNNSAHAMDNKGTIEVSLMSQSKDNHQEFCLLEVKDKGHGIATDIQDKIFDPFFTTKPVNEGTGLGLSVIYGIVKSYKGNIEFESVEGKGSIFKVILPYPSSVAASDDE